MQYFFYTHRIYLPYCLAHLLYIYRKETNTILVYICMYTVTTYSNAIDVNCIIFDVMYL